MTAQGIVFHSHGVNGAGDGGAAAGDAHALKGGTRRRGAAVDGSVRQKGHLAIGAHVRQQGGAAGVENIAGQQAAGDVRAHVGRQAGGQVHLTVRAPVKAQLPRGDRFAEQMPRLKGCKGNVADIVAPQQVQHGGVAGDDRAAHIGHGAAYLSAQLIGQVAETPDNAGAQGVALTRQRGVQTGHHVRAEPLLRVFAGGHAQAAAAVQIPQVSGHGSGTDVHADAQSGGPRVPFQPVQGAAGLHQQTVLPREGQLRVGAADPGKAGKAHTPGQLPGWQLGQFLRRGGGQVAVGQHAALAAAALPAAGIVGV